MLANKEDNLKLSNISVFKKNSNNKKSIVNDKKKLNSNNIGVQNVSQVINSNKKSVDELLTKNYNVKTNQKVKSQSKESDSQIKTNHRSHSFGGRRDKDNQIESIKAKLMESFGFKEQHDTQSLFNNNETRNIKKAQEEHSKDPEKQTKVILDIYKEHKLNPFMGFLFILIQCY